MDYSDISGREIEAVRTPRATRKRKVKSFFMNTFLVVFLWGMVSFLLFAAYHYPNMPYYKHLMQMGIYPSVLPDGKSPLGVFFYIWCFGLGVAIAATIFFLLLGKLIRLFIRLVPSALKPDFLVADFIHQQNELLSDGERTYMRGSFLAGAKEFELVFKKRFPDKPRTVRLAGVPIPPNVENAHTLISASTGAGKSVTLTGLLRSIRERGDRAIVLDNNREFYNKFHREGDLAISAFDENSFGWTLGGEVRAPYDWDRFAEALIPKLSGSGEEWQGMARALFSAVGKNLLALDGKASNADILRLLTVADIDELAPFLDGTPAAMLTAKDDKAVSRLQSIRLSFLSSLQALSYVKDGDFSFRQWTQDKDGKAGVWLFLPYTDYEISIAKSLLATWLDIVVMSALENPDSSKTTWLIIDELDSLGAIPALIVGATRLRKAGFAIVAAVQDHAQLRETYGKNRANTVINNLSNKFIMRTVDHEAAEDLSKALGEQEYVEKRVSSSYGQSGDNYSSNSTTSHHTMKNRLVMPAEIAQLPTGTGYLKFAGEWPVLKVTAPKEE